MAWYDTVKSRFKSKELDPKDPNVQRENPNDPSVGGAILFKHNEELTKRMKDSGVEAEFGPPTMPNGQPLRQVKDKKKY